VIEHCRTLLIKPSNLRYCSEKKMSCVSLNNLNAATSVINNRGQSKAPSNAADVVSV